MTLMKTRLNPRPGKELHPGLTLLRRPDSPRGRGTPIPRSPAKARLETFRNACPRRDYWIHFECPEFTALCPITGQPDFGAITIDYIPDRVCLESKSLKLYLFSYRNHGAFHEACTLDIAKRLIGLLSPKWQPTGSYWYPRGGMPIDVFYQTGEPPAGLWIPPQDVPVYRGRP